MYSDESQQSEKIGHSTMKVTKAQAQANRAHIVETASALFRERGYDGVGVVDLMAAAGFTHGGFYKHFGSKSDLMAESAARGIAQTAALSAGVDTPDFVRAYVSREHRDARASGCTMAALGGDAARQPDAVRSTFAAGIESLMIELSRAGNALDSADSRQVRARSLNIMAHAVGAIVLSRACPDDSLLADEILAACRDSILASLPSPAGQTAHAGVQERGELISGL
jgi:TetR/AcrR family transcriptional regulator, transcriptional repressor for nem operon